MGLWEGFALGLMTGGVFGIAITGICMGFAQADECADCQSEIIRSLQGKIKEVEK